MSAALILAGWLSWFSPTQAPIPVIPWAPRPIASPTKMLPRDQWIANCEASAVGHLPQDVAKQICTHARDVQEQHPGVQQFIQMPPETRS